MLRTDTHFEQIPLEAIKPLIRKAFSGDPGTEQTPTIKEKDSKAPVKEEA
jgi:hypothetical protein